MADNTSADTLEASSQSQDTKSAGGEQSSSTHGGAGTDPTPASRDDTNTGLTNSGGVVGLSLRASHLIFHGEALTRFDRRIQAQTTFLLQ